MKNKILYRLVIIGILFVALMGFLAKIFVLDNFKMLCQLAEGFGEPSAPYYLFLERVYKISERNDIGKEIVESLSNDEDRYLRDCYIRVLGVTGEHGSLQLLESISNSEIKERNFPIIFYSIMSIGLLGDNRAVPFLEKFLEKNVSDLQSHFLDFTAVNALYLLTGSDNYYFINSSGERQRLIITKRLSEARKVITEAKGRKRTYEEMIVLDKIFRHPDY